MRTKRSRTTLFALVLVLALTLTGCGINSTVEDLFMLPRVPDEYTGLSQQIEQLLADGYEYAPPVTGQNIQSVQMVDLDGDGVQEAVAFLRRPADEKPLKVLVYQQLDDSYELLCAVESSGSSIDSVYYEDLTGDGRSELVVGWKISNTVQTVAVYSIGREAIPLMSSGYTRFVVQDLNGYDPPALFVLRGESNGTPLAEVYTWQTNILAAAYRCGLSSSMADLSRGSVVAGRLYGGKPAVFITGINDSNMAVTDILTWDTMQGLINLLTDEGSGKTSVVYPYNQLIPQDMNNDGVTEVPYPDEWGMGNDTLTYWMQYNRTGYSPAVAQTYHCQSGGWYFQFPDNWWGSVTADSQEVVAGEKQVTLYVDEKPLLSIYTITNENRESRAVMGERFLLRRQTDTVYAAELYEDAAWYELDAQKVKECFHMMVSTWQPSGG